MKQIKNVLFDLDGTLSDSSEGITKSICHALKQLGVEQPKSQELLWCIGPPLKNSFAKLLSTNDEELIEQALVHFRERYRQTGMFENTLYDGVRDMLGQLNRQGVKLFVASAKYIAFCREIIKYFKLGDLFEGVYGAELDGTRLDKRELVKYILDKYSLDQQETLMVGDRDKDVEAGNVNGLFSMGVTYGFGSTEEIEKSSPTFIVKNPKEILHHFSKS